MERDSRRVLELPARRESRNTAVDTLCSAFENDIMWRTLIPDAAERARVMSALWRGVLGYCLRYGKVYSTPEVEGIAAWTLPGMNRPTLWRILRTGFGLMRSIFPMSSASRQRFLANMKQIDVLHQQLMSDPHWYLWALGVHQEAQSQGIGSSLLQPVMESAEREGVPCYLETETEGNVAFYQRRGFEVVHEAEIGDPAFRLWFMVRPI